MQSPFDQLGPEPLAREAAEALQHELRRTGLGRSDGGKMFGVLVAEDVRGERRVLRAFSGMLEGRWTHEGFAPPLFDPARRADVEPAGEAVVKQLIARAAAFAHQGGLAEARAEAEAMRARHAGERRALKERHAARRTERQQQRVGASPDRMHALDQQSRGDKAELRRLEAAHEEERARVEPRLIKLDRRARALERLRHAYCRALMRRIHETYEVPNAAGRRAPLRELYAPGEPPSGAADCAAPKLLAQAYAEGLRPVALAEFWWGPPPASGGRLEGAYYPACREKCGPLLPFMLQGVEVAPPRLFSPAPFRVEPLRIVHEDAWVVVIDKPAGLLSVPGKDAALEDSVLTRLRARHPEATGPLLVHRLDLDTSGLLVAALDKETHAHLQRQFLQREVEKRYVAVLNGEVRGEEGVIELPLRVDVNDRPRQIHDPVHGRAAVTRWQVLQRQRGQTRVALQPLTGRTHQLRAHAAHPEGLGAAIVGDRLYGSEGARLMLHAERIAFRHPRTGERVFFEVPAPF